MIRETSGDILTADVEALVNPVSTVGVMGAGLALAFKRKYPDMYREYALGCKHDGFDVGQVMEHEVGEQPRYVISFPTKQHWRNPSKLEWINSGLIDLRRAIEDFGIKSIAIPALGCGLGGLAWKDVRKLIVQHLGDLDVDVVLYAPRAS